MALKRAVEIQGDLKRAVGIQNGAEESRWDSRNECLQQLGAAPKVFVRTHSVVDQLVVVDNRQ